MRTSDSSIVVHPTQPKTAAEALEACSGDPHGAVAYLEAITRMRAVSLGGGEEGRQEGGHGGGGRRGGEPDGSPPPPSAADGSGGGGDGRVKGGSDGAGAGGLGSEGVYSQTNCSEESAHLP